MWCVYLSAHTTNKNHLNYTVNEECNNDIRLEMHNNMATQQHVTHTVRVFLRMEIAQKIKIE